MRPGTDVTVVTYGALVQRALTAAKEVEETAGVERRGHRPALALAGGLGDDRRVGPQDEPRARRPRGLALVGLRRRDRGADRPASSSPGSTRRCGASPRSTPSSPTPRTLEDHILPQVADIAAAIRELAAF